MCESLNQRERERERERECVCKNGESGCWNGFRERLGVCVRERGREYANMLYVVERERERERERDGVTIW